VEIAHSYEKIPRGLSRYWSCESSVSLSRQDDNARSTEVSEVELAIRIEVSGDYIDIGGPVLTGNSIDKGCLFGRFKCAVPVSQHHRNYRSSSDVIVAKPHNI